MPYISNPHREALTPTSLTLAYTAGELNFQITTLVNRWLAQHGLSYVGINAAIGVLECAKLELYRRVAGPYEDVKIEQNGDVFSNDLKVKK